MTGLALALAILPLLWVTVLAAFSKPLAARWCEPVLRHPALILESDDWGAGPPEQSLALRRLAAVLGSVRDQAGRSALMTLGIVMEVPDGARMAGNNCTTYEGLTLDDGRFGDVQAAIHEGLAAGVFAPQLHGQCHYWPAAVMAVAQRDPSVRSWLTSPEPAQTEALPSPLQSRWVDASGLPSRALPAEAIAEAVSGEAAEYARWFGQAPQVAVATTFVWNETVEAAWAHAGVEVIITPGSRATCRTATGEPGCVDATMLTGERSRSGQTYLVRDVYFEPALGHPAQRLVEGVRQRARQGRACLVETHRFNFLQAHEASLSTLEAGLKQALAACPGVRFASPIELARALQRRDPAWVETGMRARLAAWRARLDEVPRFRRVARMTGLAIPLALLGCVT